MSKPSLEYLFNPKSIAVAGAAPDGATPNLARNFVMGLMEFGFKGDIYPLHPSGGEVLGIKVYTSIKEIQGPVDYVISAIPARYTPQLVEDCGAKGVRAVHFFSAGFGEIEDEIGQQLQERILHIAREAGIRVVGPNCMGIYCPKTGMTFARDFQGQTGFPRETGSLGLISQSGGNCILGIREASARNVFFSKAISYGNAADLNECDYLEYMTDDPDTKVIAIYIEGVRDGRRFISTLRKANVRKPVIINKAGNSETGKRACASHTSSIAGSTGIWQELIKQVGAVQVGSIAELVDVSLTFLKLAVPAGRNIAVIGSGGGVSVQAADDVSQAGLNLPELPAGVRKELHNIYGTEAGYMFRNPVDMPIWAKVEAVVSTIKIISESDTVDAVIMQFPFDLWAMIDQAQARQKFVELVPEVIKVIKKPMVVVLHNAVTSNSRQRADEAHDKFVEMGLPVYSSIHRAANAMSKCISYYEDKGIIHHKIKC